MKAGVLFSGGKDSALAALLLSRDYDVELNTVVFTAEDDPGTVRDAARMVGLPWVQRTFDAEFLEQVVDMVIECRYPNEAIQAVHRQALEQLCCSYRVVADGTRMDDRVPLSLAKRGTEPPGSYRVLVCTSAPWIRVQRSGPAGKPPLHHCTRADRYDRKW